MGDKHFSDSHQDNEEPYNLYDRVFLPGHRSFAGPQDDNDLDGGSYSQAVFVKRLIGEIEFFTT